jgi:hypothetical protein
VLRRKKLPVECFFVKSHSSIRRLATTVAQLTENLRYTWPRLRGWIMWQKWFSDEFTLTKRHLGVLLLLAGLMLLAAAVLAEVVRSGPGGIGTVQQLSILVGILSTIAGTTLLPLGDQPA